MLSVNSLNRYIYIYIYIWLTKVILSYLSLFISWLYTAYPSTFISSLKKYKICHISFIPTFWCSKSSFSKTQNKTTRNFRSSRPKVFLGKGVLKICSKFTGEHPCIPKFDFNKVARQLATLKFFQRFSQRNLKCKSLFNFCLNHKILGSFYWNKKISEKF